MTNSKIKKAAILIERVLRPTLWTEEVTPTLAAIRDKIGKRYSELKSTTDFSSAAAQARVEWLVDYLQKLDSK